MCKLMISKAKSQLRVATVTIQIYGWHHFTSKSVKPYYMDSFYSFAKLDFFGIYVIDIIKLWETRSFKFQEFSGS